MNMQQMQEYKHLRETVEALVKRVEALEAENAQLKQQRPILSRNNNGSKQV